jgi:hypothetical protein
MRRFAALAFVALACGGDDPRAEGNGPPPVPTPPEDRDAASPGDATPAADAGAPTFTVLALNLHCLKTTATAFATNAERFSAIANAARDFQVDAILAQEVCERPGESTRELLTSELERATEARWSSASAFAHRAWDDTPDEADEHVAIFARGAIAAPRETVHRAQGNLRRVTLGATVEAKVGDSGTRLRVRVFTVHLDHRAAEARAAQAREVASAAMVEGDDEALEVPDSGVSLPIVVGGDFNARDKSPALDAMRDYGFTEVSGSAGSTRIDHVFAHRSAPMEPIESSVILTGNDAVSDHPGILVRFGSRAPTPVRLTRIRANVPTSTPLTVRGSAAPLDWELGWPAFPKIGATAGVLLITSELPAGSFEYKVLRSDVDWQEGENAIGKGHEDNVVTPTFP